jgi:hypothetical protein
LVGFEYLENIFSCREKCVWCWVELAMFSVYLSLAADTFELIFFYCDSGHAAETSISAGVIYVAQDDKSSESLQVHMSSLPEVL